MEILTEIRDGVAGLGAEIEALRDQLIELKAAHARERTRAVNEAAKRRALEHEVREMGNRLLILEGERR